MHILLIIYVETVKFNRSCSGNNINNYKVVQIATISIWNTSSFRSIFDLPFILLITKIYVHFFITVTCLKQFTAHNFPMPQYSLSPYLMHWQNVGRKYYYWGLWWIRWVIWVWYSHKGVHRFWIRCWEKSIRCPFWLERTSCCCSWFFL